MNKNNWREIIEFMPERKSKVCKQKQKQKKTNKMRDFTIKDPFHHVCAYECVRGVGGG